MARFFGAVGYGETEETSPGVYTERIVTKNYYGDVIKDTRKLDKGLGANSDISVTNSISIVVDAYANEHFHAIRFVSWAGARWVVDNVEVQSPRLLLRLGGIYNGPTS